MKDYDGGLRQRARMRTIIYVVGGDVKLRWAMVECCLGTNMYSMAMMGGFDTRTVMGRQCGEAMMVGPCWRGYGCIRRERLILLMLSSKYCNLIYGVC
jgi:hypothetical protein